MIASVVVSSTSSSSSERSSANDSASDGSTSSSRRRVEPVCLAHDADESPRHPGSRRHRVVGRCVAGDRGAVDQCVVVPVIERPRSHLHRRLHPPIGGGLPGCRRSTQPSTWSPSESYASTISAVSSSSAAGEVAVDRRRHHADVAGDGAQRQIVGTVARRAVSAAAARIAARTSARARARAPVTLVVAIAGCWSGPSRQSDRKREQCS